jgi:hypothetical protein
MIILSLISFCFLVNCVLQLSLWMERNHTKGWSEGWLDWLGLALLQSVLTRLESGTTRQSEPKTYQVTRNGR